MRIVLITHAQTVAGPPRGLSDEGVASARKAAARIHAIMGERWRVHKAVSSPAVRCVQTALVVASALAGEKLRRLDTDPRLMAAADPMGPDQLARALADYTCEGLLVALHADLASALPGREGLLGSADGWFSDRPIACVLEWEGARPWEENRIIVLEGPDGRSLLPPGQGGPDPKLLI